MSQARRTRYFAQSGRRGEERRASLKITHTRRLAYKAPVMHATIVYLITSSLGKQINVLILESLDNVLNLHAKIFAHPALT